MKSPKPPAPPDPKETAGAQTANNVGTAIANAHLGNVNQVTPDGSLTYSQTGTYKYTDPNTGSEYDIPTFTATQSLSPGQQLIHDKSTEAQGNLASMAADQSARISQHLGSTMNFDSLPQGGSAGGVAGYMAHANGRDGIRTNVDPRTGEIQRGVDSRAEEVRSGARSRSGDIQQGLASRSGELQSSIDAGTAEIQGQVDRQQFQQGFDEVGAGPRTYGTDFSDDRRRVEAALMSRMNPQLERDRESLRTSLINQGIREGSEAFDRAMSRADQASTDARMQAILAGGQEQSRLAGLEAQRAAFESSAQQQAYNQAQGRASFGNSAKAQQYQADLAGASLANSAAGQRFGQQLQAAQFGNQATGQQFAQDAEAMRLNNAAVDQAQAQDLRSVQSDNDATAQRFQQDLGAGAFRNQATSQAFTQDLGSAQHQNAAQAQRFGQAMAIQQRADQDRAVARDEAMALRNQPINEIGALLGTGQVSQPNFVNPNISSIAGTDRAGIEMGAYGQQLDAWKAQTAYRQSLMGGILGAGGQLGAAALMSDRRIKSDIRRIGRNGRLPVYEFRYIGDDQKHVGFMAQDVLKVDPGAIVFLEGGLMAVDYDKAREAAG
ncbi:tail fiber domain-containing protein [Phaeobacter italicus]|nr:tail fiber domain-containing protein [Phaeobacter italicus]